MSNLLHALKDTESWDISTQLHPLILKFFKPNDKRFNLDLVTKEQDAKPPPQI